MVAVCGGSDFRASVGGDGNRRTGIGKSEITFDGMRREERRGKRRCVGAS